ncbi:MAG: nitroreductase family protein [Bacteroidota bacterium]
MSFLDLVMARQSVREYAPKPVEREKIERCLEAARLAPSACNAQPWRFIVVDDARIREKVAKEVSRGPVPLNAFAAQAPVIVVIVLERSNASAQVGALLKRIPYRLIDLGIAAEHFCLQASEEGLGTCILGWFNERGLRKTLGIPATRRIGLVLTVGYPRNNERRTKARKEIQEIRSYNRF